MYVYAIECKKFNLMLFRWPWWNVRFSGCGDISYGNTYIGVGDLDGCDGLMVYQCFVVVVVGLDVQYLVTS